MRRISGVPAALRRVRQTLRKIDRLDLAADFRADLKKSYLRTFVLKRYDKEQKIADIAGFRVKFQVYDHLYLLFREIFTDRSYAFASHTDTPFIVDCGSNIGLSVLYFKRRFPKAEIIAFEPNDESFRCLQHNVEENGLQGVTIHNKALLDHPGDVSLYRDPDDPTSGCSSLLRDRMPGDEQPAQAVRLSEYIDRPVDFLKMDIEGVETEVIRELSAAGKLETVRQMIMEYHHHVKADRDDLAEMLSYLQKAGLGYQIGSGLKRPSIPYIFQDVTLYAYQKSLIPPPAGDSV